MKNVHLSKWMGVVLGVVLLGWSSEARAASESAAGLTDAASRPLVGPAGSMAAQPPEPAAAETLAVYLRGLADTDYSKALFCVEERALLLACRGHGHDKPVVQLRRPADEVEVAERHWVERSRIDSGCNCHVRIIS